MILLALLRQSAPTIMGLLSDCTFAFLALKYFDLVFTLKYYNNNFQSTTLMLAFEWFLTNIGIQSFNTEFNNMHHLCLLVCVFFYSHLRIFHSYGDITITSERAANFDLCSALMAIEQWGFSSMPHLLWYGTSVYNGHLWGPVTNLLPSD